MVVAGLLSSDSKEPLIATSVRQRYLPTTVFVHGLDSSKQTWSSVQSDLLQRGYPSIAMDLRGHGESDLGDPSDFSAEALARDVLNVAQDLKGGPVVLVGHSMGGRVVMRAAALDLVEEKKVLGALIVEDVDTRNFGGGDEKNLEPFSREFATLDDAKKALINGGYDLDRVNSWVGTRLRRMPNGRWHSDLSPQAQELAWQHVLNVDDADRAWDILASTQDVPFSVHLWIASDKGTVCKRAGPKSIGDLVDRLPTAKLQQFDRADHSIHNTDRLAFVNALITVIDDLSKKQHPPVPDK